MPDLTKNLKDAGYVAIGLGVLGFQRAQVLRNDLRKSVVEQLRDARLQVEKGRDRLETQVQKATNVVGEQLDELQDLAKDARGQLTGLLTRSA